MSEKKVVVIESDMPDELQERAKDSAKLALEKCQSEPPHNEKAVAQILKSEFDKYYFPAWHCIVGKSFGSHVGREEGSYIFFKIGVWHILLFKCG